MGEIQWGSVLATLIAGAVGAYLGCWLYIWVHRR